jgi:flagellar biosynthesis chaperone FliJ
MKSSRKLRILKVKEYIARAKLQRASTMLERSNNNIEQLESYSLAYLSASRKKENLTAYEMNNVISMSKNLQSVVNHEKNSQQALKHMYERAKDGWMKEKTKTKYFTEKEELEKEEFLTILYAEESAKLIGLKIIEDAIQKAK